MGKNIGQASPITDATDKAEAKQLIATNTEAVPAKPVIDTGGAKSGYITVKYINTTGKRLKVMFIKEDKKES